MSIDYHEMPDGVHGWQNQPVVILLAGNSKYAVDVYKPAYFYSRVAGRWVEIPTGFKSDLLTIPWWVRWMISPSGPGRAEAVLHDWLVDPTTRPDWVDSKIALAIFEEGLILSVISKKRRRSLVWGVRVGGPRF